MSDLSQESRAVLESARRELAPSVEHRLRLREAILERVASSEAVATQQAGPRFTLKVPPGAPGLAPGKVIALAFTADGRTLITQIEEYSDRQVRLWRTAAPEKSGETKR